MAYASDVSDENAGVLLLRAEGLVGRFACVIDMLWNTETADSFALQNAFHQSSQHSYISKHILLKSVLKEGLQKPHH